MHIIRSHNGDLSAGRGESDPIFRRNDSSNDYGSVEEEQPSSPKWWHEIELYSSYVLVILLLANLFNELDRYILAITITPIVQELQFGDQSCLRNYSVQAYGWKLECNATNVDSCVSIHNPNGTSFCKWDYNGEGWDYELLAGPVFILIYTFAGVFIGLAADQYNRKLMLSVCLTFWSIMTLLTGLVHEYWQLAVLRFGLGLGEAGCAPLAASLIADYFSQALRGTALSIYNLGIYFGYGLSYAVGNYITLANINGQGWRWAFILPGIPGALLGFVIAVTVKEPERRKQPVEHGLESSSDSGYSSRHPKLPLCTHLSGVFKHFLRLSLLLLCLAGSVRIAGGYVWAYNTQSYFDASKVAPETVSSYMSWIPLAGGSLGVLLGGFISDRVIKRRGIYARIFVLVASQFLATPFAAGALFLDAPLALISLIPATIFGEMWIGVTLAVVMELVPSHLRTLAVAVYLFIITNIGGNVLLLVPFIQKHLESVGYTQVQALRGALYILYPGLVLLGGVLFLLSLLVVKRDHKRAQNAVYSILAET